MQNTKITSSDWDFEDLKTPEHDRMILWLLDKNNLRSLWPKDGDLSVKEYKIEIRDIRTEVPVTSGNNKFIVGYIDIYCRWILYKVNDKGEKETVDLWDVFLEVKPKIDSFGAVVRQINKYRENGKIGHWIVFTEDENADKFKEAFGGQEIHLFRKPAS